MTWRKILPNLFTLGALACAVLSILQAIHGEFLAAAQLIMLCLILDGFDGNVARLFKGESQFGAELDTFVDIIGYGVAPAVLAYELVMQEHGLLGLAFTLWTVMAGALRLSRFRSDPDRGNKGFVGLPITVNSSWIAAFVFVTQSGQISEDWFSLHEGTLAAIVWTCSVLFLVLQISTVRYSKPSKTPALFVGGIVLVAMLFLHKSAGLAAGIAMVTYLFFFALISPFLPRHQQAMEAAAEQAEADEDEDEESPDLRSL